MGTRKVPICTKMQKEKYFLRKERFLNQFLNPTHYHLVGNQPISCVTQNVTRFC